VFRRAKPSAQNKRTRVIHLITLLELGGAQGNTLYTVQHLDPNTFEAHLWAGKGGYWDPEAERSLGSRLKFLTHMVRPINPWHDFWAVIELWRALKKAKPDIVHTHSSKAGIIGRIAARLAGVPMVVHTFHGFGFNDQQKPLARRLFVELERLTARLSSRLVFVSNANLRTASENRIGRVFKYALIRSGVPIPAIRAEAQRVDAAKLKNDLQIPLTNRIVTTIGPFKPQKNLSDFIKMAEIVSKQISDVSFLVIGDGALRAALEAQVQAAGLSSLVRMPGWRRDAASCLAVSSVFCLTSLWEGLPRALVEALVVGIPAVCYDTDGVRDLFEQGGVVKIPQFDFRSMAATVTALLNDPGRLRTLANSTSLAVGTDFDIDVMVQQQEKLYLDLKGGTRGRLETA